MQGPKLLMLYWRSISGHTSNVVASILAMKGGRLSANVWMWQHSPCIVNDAKLTLFDIPLTLCLCSVDCMLTLIFRTQYWCSLKHFCQERWPVVRSWVNVAAQPLDFLRCMVQNRWRSVDPNFKALQRCCPSHFCPEMGLFVQFWDHVGVQPFDFQRWEV